MGVGFRSEVDMEEFLVDLGFCFGLEDYFFLPDRVVIGTALPYSLVKQIALI